MDSVTWQRIAVPKIVPIFATEDYGNPLEGYSNPTDAQPDRKTRSGIGLTRLSNPKTWGTF